MNVSNQPVAEVDLVLSSDHTRDLVALRCSSAELKVKLKSETKFWDVRFSQPYTRKYVVNGEEKEYDGTKNVHVMAAADSVAKVTELVMAEFPDATIHQINHRGGDCAIVIQPELLV